MARAKVRTRKAHRLHQYGYVFRKDADKIITDEKLIEKLKIDPQYKVIIVKVEELAAKPDPKDDFLKPEAPAEQQEEYKYHKLIAMNKAELQEIAYAMGAKYDEDATKKVIVQAILDKQLGFSDEVEESAEVSEDEISS